MIMIQDLTITQTNMTNTEIATASACIIGLKSLQLWMEQFLAFVVNLLVSWIIILMHGHRQLCVGRETDPECTEVWAARPGSCEGNPVKQKDDVFSCKMAPCLMQDSRAAPLIEHRTGLESKMVTPQVSEWSQYVVLWPNYILHTNCIQYGPYNF